jgi:broad specificity phosphatase PhoE
MCFHVFIIRHGERQDHADPLAKYLPVQSDPPLTDEGLRASTRTGGYIASLLKEYGIVEPQVVVYASPYTRCLQTAQRIATSFPGCAVVLDTAFMEWRIGKLIGQHDIMPTLDLQERAAIYGAVVRTTHHHDWTVEESRNMLKQRFQQGLDAITPSGLGNHVAIVVTHAVGVQTCLELFESLNGWSSAIASFCSITHATLNQNGWQLHKRTSIDHL